MVEKEDMLSVIIIMQENKISDKGTWESNPLVVAYSFELVDQRMEELRVKYGIPITHVEMIDCSFLLNKRKSKSRAGSTPYASKRKKKRKK